MERIVLRSLVAVLVTACLDAPTTPTPQEVPYDPSLAVIGSTHFFEVTPEAGLVVHNECSGEDVLLTEGKFQFVQTQTVNENVDHGTLHQVSAG